MREGFTQVLAPLLSVNEPEAQLVEVFITTGGKVAVGDPLCTLETTKATFEVQAEVDGYVHTVLVAKGDQVVAGTVLFDISPAPPTERPAELSVSSVPSPDVSVKPEGLLITEKGMRVAKELGVPLDSLPLGALVTEAMVRAFSAKQAPPAGTRTVKAVAPVRVPFQAGEVLMIGAGGHAAKVIDLIRQANHYHLAGLIDESPHPAAELLGVPVLGGVEVLQSLYDKGIRLMINGVGGIDRNQIRHDVFVRMAERGFAFPRIVHPKATVEPSAELAAGVQIFGMAFVGAAARVGFGAIINTGAIISHDCIIGDLAHITPGAILAGRVEVGAGALIGMGVTVDVRVRVGEWARIGNGARINGDVPPHAIVKGGTTWP